MQKLVRTVYLRRALTTVAIASVGLTTASSALTASAVLPKQVVFSQSRSAVARASELHAGIDAVDAAVATAGTLLSTSAGLVADDAVRTALSATIGTASTSIDAARAQLLLDEFAANPPNRSVTAYLGVVLGQLDAAEKTVTASEAQRVADLAAAKAAAERAAAARAAAARATERRAAAAAAPVAAGIHTVNVWTAGWQAQIDQCRGAVDLTGNYLTPTVGEHWSCGGSAFPENAGATVRITGLRAGTYTVIGVVAVLNPETANASRIPHGYALLFQTCRGNDSTQTVFIALRRD